MNFGKANPHWPRLACVAAAILGVGLLAASPLAAQQGEAQITIGTPKRPLLALPDFVANGVAANLQQTFNSVLWNDLYQSGLVQMVAKSMDPVTTPSQPSDMNAAALAAWTAPPAQAQRLVFGSMQMAGNQLVVQGYLYDLTQPASPFMIGKRYTDVATMPATREIAHAFADAIVAALGGGPGIAESRIAFVSTRSGSEELWIMDYDGANPQQLTHLGRGSIIYSPRLSPDGRRIAYISYQTGSPQIHVYSLDTHSDLPFPRFAGLVETPAWSPDGSRLAFATSQRGDNVEICTVDAANGRDLRQLTFSTGSNLAPVYNPKTGAQIAFVSDRAGLPQIYVMDADGANQQRITTGGYAVSPSWSPNGQLLAFAWVRNGGGENSGDLDIYLYDLAAQNYVQLTHNEEFNDYPSWAPDGRHVVFQSGTPTRTQLFTVLADGSDPAQLTTTGSNQMPNWSWH